MSILSRIYLDILSLLSPARCVGCGRLLGGRRDWICSSCRATRPSTDFHLQPQNPMLDKVQSLCPNVVSATAQFYYVHDGNWRRVIHAMKYHNQWRTARKMGYIYGCELMESPIYQDVDLVIPIPLHRARRLARHYNQSELIAAGIAEALDCEMNVSAVCRTRHNPSQVTQERMDRWTNVEDIFAVLRPEELEGRHLLLVDDVFTTGATVISCIETIENAVRDCRISVATLAVSRKEIMGYAI